MSVNFPVPAIGGRLRLAYTLRQWGWPLSLALAALALALALQGSGIASAQERLTELNRDTERLAARAARPVARAPVALPPESALPEVLRAIMESAKKQGVATESGDYRQSREGRTLRCRLVLPVQASFPQLRAWLAETLNSHPGAALDELHVHRAVTAEGVVQGRVQISLYLEGAK